MMLAQVKAHAAEAAFWRWKEYLESSQLVIYWLREKRDMLKVLCPVSKEGIPDGQLRTDNNNVGVL